MKRSLSILFILVLITCLCFNKGVLGEEFSIRNGIKFGMTKAEIKEIEKKNGIGNKLMKGSYDNLLIYKQVTLCGIDNSQILYRIDDDRIGLIQITYNFDYSGDSYHSEAQCHNAFLEFKEMLCEKYGQFETSSEQNQYLSWGICNPEFALEWVEWVLPQGDNYLYIFLKNGVGPDLPAIYYKIYSKNDIESIIEDEKLKENEEKNNKLKDL